MAPEIKTIYAKDRQAWRRWLEKNHEKEQSVWLIYYKKASNKKSVKYSEAVDEALCFGWIDSKAKPIDAEQYMQFFSRRKPKSVWSRINKEKIERLIEQGLMTEAGHKVIRTAKENGSWTILDEAEQHIIPDDLAQALGQNPNADSYFSGLSRSDRRNILQWLVLAKRAETRQKRIEEIVSLAAQNKKPKQFS